MSFNRIPEPWGAFLAGVDAGTKGRTEGHCLGGFAVTVLYGLARPTADVDVVSITPRVAGAPLLRLAGKGSELHRRHGV